MLSITKNRNTNRKNRNELFVIFKGIEYGRLLVYCNLVIIFTNCSNRTVTRVENTTFYSIMGISLG